MTPADEDVLPNFLVIGAYKAGTTSIFEDLARHPEIGVPAAKEVGHLAGPEVMTAEGRRRYASYFAPLKGQRRRGEVAPQYTAAPKWTGAAARARELLGEDLRLIYVVRHPLTRLYSHLVHRGRTPEVLFGQGGCPPPGEVPEFDASRYGTQIEPWLAQFPPDRLLVVAFENYRDAPAEVRRRMFRFLGVADRSADAPPTHANATGMRRQKPFWLQRALNSDLYRARIKGYVPAELRRGAARILAKRPTAQSGEARRDLDPMISARVREALLPDIRMFYRQVGVTDPLWPDFPLHGPSGRREPEPSD